MNENMYYHRREDDETTIDLRNLFGHILKKWKLILAVTIVCALIGGITGFLKSDNSSVSAPLSSEERIAAAAEGLNEAQKSEAENYFEQLKAYDKAISEQKKINEESYLMNLDTSAAAYSIILYMLETDLGNAASVYPDMLTDEDYGRISDILGIDRGSNKLKEVVTIWSDESTDTYDMDITRTDRMLGDIKNEYKLLLKMTVAAPDRSSCDKIIEVVDAAVKRETDNIAGYGAKIKCTLLSNRNCDMIAEEKIAESNQLKINTLGKLVTDRSNFYNNVISRADTGEKAYIDALYYTDNEESQETTTELVVSRKDILKKAILFAFAGAFALICIVTVMYVSGGKLHIAEEVSNMGIPVFGTLSADKPDSFSVFIEEFRKKTEAEMKRIYIAVDKSSVKAMEYAQRISGEANENVICYTGGIIPDSGDMKELLGSDGVFLLPVIECTKRDSIVTVADICTRNGIRIIGSAPIK